MKWYKRDPEAFAGGTAELSLEEVGAYSLVVDAYYARDGRLPDDDYLLSRILRCNPRTWRKIKIVLFKKRKLTVDDDLLIPNRGLSTLNEARTFSERQSNRARTRWEGNEKPHEIKDAAMPSTTTTTIREEKKERAATSAAPPKRAVKTTLPESWHPMEVLSPSESLELEKMRDWAKAGAIRKADWFATWRNWKRRSPQFNGGGSGSRLLFDGQPARGSREDRNRRTAEAFDKLDEFIDRSDGQGDGCEIGPALVGRLPKPESA